MKALKLRRRSQWKKKKSEKLLTQRDKRHIYEQTLWHLSVSNHIPIWIIVVFEDVCYSGLWNTDLSLSGSQVLSPLRSLQWMYTSDALLLISHKCIASMLSNTAYRKSSYCIILISLILMRPLFSTVSAAPSEIKLPASKIVNNKSTKARLLYRKGFLL